MTLMFKARPLQTLIKSNPNSYGEDIPWFFQTFSWEVLSHSTCLLHNSRIYLMNYVICLFYNFTVTVYCQHILNFGEEDSLSQNTEDFPEYSECWKALGSGVWMDLSAVKRYQNDIFIFGLLFPLMRHLTYGEESFHRDTSADRELAH